MKRTKEQWLALFAEQAQSGLTQTAFAKRQGIIPTYFNLRKRQLLAHQNDDTGFIELAPQSSPLAQHILLRKRDMELQLPAGTDALWLAALLRAL
ncbi:IS66 family insertion sequence element accessory protein TnpB [Alishewanella sp. 16-MA]|uniref:IS66 family insertion sequence element accessory protein TnpB n=1 Tax=Alishewanella maricola TaxID=2795740 RepID=A0ABS8C8D8_9ALTE|nr:MULTISPECIES: IS66 family insertion sequence element accessory protein TnpB [Gammaproteobacteria]MCB5228433.1 IS66 family insertion sequence element accessory protein TnpB [Alishewanella maricola]